MVTDKWYRVVHVSSSDVMKQSVFVVYLNIPDLMHYSRLKLSMMIKYLLVWFCLEI